MQQTVFFLDLFAALVTAVLILFYIVDKEHSDRFSRPLLRWLIVHFFLLLTDGCASLFLPVSSPAAKVFLIAARILFFADLLLYSQYQVFYLRATQTDSGKRLLFSPVILCAAAVMFWFYDIIGENGLLVSPGSVTGSGGTVYWIHLALTGVLLLLCVLPVYQSRKHILQRNALSLLSYGLLPLLCLPAAALGYPVTILLAETLALVILYLIIYAEQSRTLSEQKTQILQKENEIIQQKAELTDLRRKIMISQIQPHFLYNVLNTIYYVCGKDSKLAQRAISHFSDYLRANLDALSRESLVPFESELKHVQTYLWLEKLRFDDELTVILDTPEQDFLIPALSIQPLVENAVKHGIGKKPGGGIVSISTGKDENGYYVTVADNGVGFDPAVVLNDGRSHIGLESVSGRIEAMCHGTLEIQSVPGKGTVFTVRIPLKDGDQS